MIQDLRETRFRDIAEREIKTREELDSRLTQITEIKTTRGYNTLEEQAERQRIFDILAEIAKKGRKADEVCDPLFVSARRLFNEGMLTYRLLAHNNGFLIFSDRDKLDIIDEDIKDSDEIARINAVIVQTSLTLGFLIANSAIAPPVVLVPQASPGSSGMEAPAGDKGSGETIVPDTTHPSWTILTQSFYEAIGEARGLEELATLVLPILAREGDPDGPEGDRYKPNVRVEEFARVMRELHSRGVTVSENQLRRRVNEALDRVQFVGEKGPVEDMGINLPDLEEVTSNNIIPDNVRLMGPMIVSAMFDELKAFQVVDHLVERFQRGTLSIVSGEAGKLLYRYWREAPNRISEMERRTFYATTLGVPGGEAGDFINRNFNDLWLRFVSSVSEFVRQGEVDKLLRAGIPSPVSHQQVRKAARDLAGNLSLHGYGMAFYAAVELQEQIKFMIRLLGDEEIRGNFGARDMWQVIDQVATLELGGAKTSSRYRTLATCGTIITAWLAKNATDIMAANGALLDINEIHHPPPRISGERASTHPNDYDLVNACELWLADTGTADSQVEQLAQPYEAPVQTSRPVQVPSVVQEMLSGMGDLDIGFGKTS